MLLNVSSKKAADDELDHVKEVFCNLNDYPEGLVDQIIQNERSKAAAEVDELSNNEDDENEDGKEQKVLLALNLPYVGDKGDKIIRKMQKDLKSKLESEDKKICVRTMYRSTKLSTRFNLKDKTKPEDVHNVVYHVTCPNKKCRSTYCGETRRRLGKRIQEHREKDRKSHVRIHTEHTKRKRVVNPISRSSDRTNFRRKISEALFIKETKPDLNVQKESYKLLLFN